MTELLTPEEVAAAVKLTPQTIREMCQRGDLRATKLAGKWRIFSESVDAWIAAGEPEPGVILPLPAPGRRVAASGFKALVGGKHG